MREPPAQTGKDEAMTPQPIPLRGPFPIRPLLLLLVLLAICGGAGDFFFKPQQPTWDTVFGILFWTLALAVSGTAFTIAVFCEGFSEAERVAKGQVPTSVISLPTSVISPSMLQDLREEAERKLDPARAALQTQEAVLQALRDALQSQKDEQESIALSLRLKTDELERQRICDAQKLQDAAALLRAPVADPRQPGAVSQYLRKQHVQGAAFGDLLIATFLADRTGFIRLAWKVQVDRPQPLMIRIKRDGTLIRTDFNLAGEHGDHVIPGKPYHYVFRLMDDRGKQVGQGVHFEVNLPEAKYWDQAPDGNEDGRQRKIHEMFISRYNGLKVIEDLKIQCQADVKGKGYPKELEEWFLGKIDALGDELSGGG
jgi:hypothetical protein